MLIAIRHRRIDEACIPCRHLKKKCNGQKPCERCKRRKKCSSCNYKSEFIQCGTPKISFQPYRITKTQEDKVTPIPILPNYLKPLQDSNKSQRGSSMASLPNNNKSFSGINYCLNFSQVQVPNMNASEPQLPVTASYNVNTHCYNKELSLSLNINCHLNSLQGPALNRELQLSSNINCHLNSSKVSSIQQCHQDYQLLNFSKDRLMLSDVNYHLNSSKDYFNQLSNPHIEIGMYEIPTESPPNMGQMGQVNACFDTNYQPPLPSIFGSKDSTVIIN
ncbi:29086_t:CDS:2 [Gigaspora margarita]|uniref:29086_t:CDS:1 n=1 Tax=Gigaspora margarita TaxID=4874 RepID=A0ABN7UFL1_GIGMA|nr:29086_t:CDS:2 [Gigaspora margarita]